MKNFKSQYMESVLDMEVHWKPVEGYNERGDLGRRILDRNKRGLREMKEGQKGGYSNLAIPLLEIFF